MAAEKGMMVDQGGDVSFRRQPCRFFACNQDGRNMPMSLFQLSDIPLQSCCRMKMSGQGEKECPVMQVAEMGQSAFTLDNQQQHISTTPQGRAEKVVLAAGYGIATCPVIPEENEVSVWGSFSPWNGGARSSKKGKRKGR